MEKKDFVKFIDDLLKTYSFKKKGIKWSLINDKIIKKFILTKSRFGNFYYIEYGYILKNLELDGLLMHIHNRLSSKDSKENSRIKELLDFENNLNEEIRKKELTYFIKKEILDKFDQIINEDDILNDLKGRNNLNDIPLIVKKHFNLPVD